MVSIILVNYNGKRFLDGCLSSLSRIKYPKSCYEVIMVDNRSLDCSVEYVRNNFPWVKILALNGNYGYTGGNNRGVDVAKGDFIVFLNNDTVVDEEWLGELVKVMLRDDKIAICGSKVLSMDNPNNVQYDGGFLNLVGGTLFYPLHERKPNNDFYLVGSIHGASFLMRKLIFKLIGGFDKDFFMYSDENDLCLRVWIYGYHVAYAPHSIVYHLGRGSSFGYTENSDLKNIFGARLISPLTLYHGNKNSIASLIKNFELKGVLCGVVFSFFYSALQLLLLLKKADIQGILLLLRAIFWPIKNLKKIWKKHLIVQRSRKTSDAWLIRNQLLLSIGQTLRLVVKLRYYYNNIKQ